MSQNKEALMKIFKKMKKGFTLVELVVVIAVIAILAGVSVGAYFGITDSANNSKLQEEAKTVHTNIQLVGSKGGDNAKLSSSGLYINDLDTFKSDFIQMSGTDYEVLAGSVAPTTISKPTVYFFTASEPSGENIVNRTFKNFAYYTHEVGGKRAVGNVVTGDISVENDETFDAYSIKFAHTCFTEKMCEICDLENFPVMCKLVGKDLELAKILCDALVEEKRLPERLCHDTYVRNIIEQLVILVMRNSKNNITSNQGNTNIRKSLLYIHNNFQNDITVEEVAKICHYTPNYFSTCFKKVWG